MVGATMRSEATAAAENRGKVILNDPFAMRPFFGYNFGHYLQHWLNMESRTDKPMPKIFHVNWFRKDDKGSFMWPGFGENIRVLDWVLQRLNNEDVAEESAVGFVPTSKSLNMKGLELGSTAPASPLACLRRDSQLIATVAPLATVIIMVPQTVLAAGGAALVVTYVMNRGNNRLVRAFSGGPGVSWPAELTVSSSDQERLMSDKKCNLVRRRAKMVDRAKFEENEIPHALENAFNDNAHTRRLHCVAWGGD